MLVETSKILFYASGIIYLIYFFVMIFSLIKNKNRYKNHNLSEYITFKGSKKYLILSALILLLGIVTIFSTYPNFDPLNTMIGAVLVLFSIGDSINSYLINILYYNDDYLLINGEKIRIKSIKKLQEQKSFMSKRYELILLNNDMHMISKDVYDKITNLIKNKKSK